MVPCITSMPSGRRISRRGALGAGAAALAAPAVARAQGLRWRLVTSWPKNRTGPGVSARRIAERINLMSGGRLQVDLFAAGEIVPPFAVLDAVSNGTVELGHTAALYWQGKIPAAGFFTTVPFGLGPIEHQAWIELRDGQALWDELYKPFGVRGFLAGNTGPSMGGWFRRKIEGVEDLKGMRIRVQGLGAEIYARLGAVPMAVPAGDLLPALERGSIDAAEFLAPATDLETGLPQYAPFYYAPGFNKPNGASELLIPLKIWEQLAPDLRAVIAEACRAEHTLGLADAYQTNAVALDGHPRQVSGHPRSVPPVRHGGGPQGLDGSPGRDRRHLPPRGAHRRELHECLRRARGWSALAADMARATIRSALPVR